MTGERTQPMAGEQPETGKYWWLFLITGSLWLILSLVVLRFNLASQTTIAVLFGCVAIAAGINESMVGAAVPSWRWLHYALGALFVITGVVALFNPTETFWALAAIIGWYLLFKGTLDIVVSIATRRENEIWWLGLTVGIVQVGLAFWAAGGYGRRTVLLVVWVGAACMARGITEIVTAFRIRRLGREPAAPVDSAMAGYAAGYATAMREARTAATPAESAPGAERATTTPGRGGYPPERGTTPTGTQQTGTQQTGGGPYRSG